MNFNVSRVMTPTLAITAILAAGCSSDDDDNTPTAPTNPANVTAGVSELGLTTLAGLLTSTGLDTVLEGTGPFTLFAPTDAAFAALDADTLAFLTNAANVADLEAALRYHVLDSDTSSTAAGALSSAPTNGGGAVNIETVDGSLYINNARVAMADEIVGNGRIHVIDAVLLPRTTLDTALDERGLDNLTAAIAASSLAPLPEPLTLL
ncbi:MAG: fasciclin domain-containing protein, partial [Planctomycetota bacterium]